MIAKLKGTIDTISKDAIILDVHDIGYEVFLPNRLLANLNQGQTASFHIYSHIREDQFSLYGFADEYDKNMLLELTKVSGIGVKSALAILGIFTSEQIKQAIIFQDKAMLAQAPGIGKKAAERIITELKDKLAKNVDLSHKPQTTTNNSNDNNSDKSFYEALSALENLGYSRVQAAQTIKEVCQDKTLSLEEIITSSLRQISKK